MIHRLGTEIKTNYTSISSCVDGQGILRRDSIWRKRLMTNEILGIVRDDGTFRLASAHSFAKLHRYDGQLIMKDGYVYLSGDIRLYPAYKVYLSVVIMILTGLAFFMMFSGGYLIGLGFFYMGLIGFLLWMINWTDRLYEDLTKWFAN